MLIKMELGYGGFDPELFRILPSSLHEQLIKVAKIGFFSPPCYKIDSLLKYPIVPLRSQAILL